MCNSGVHCWVVTLLLWAYVHVILNSSPGEKCRQEAGPTLRHVLKLWEAAPGHSRTRGWDTRSGRRLCRRHHAGVFPGFNPCFAGEEAAGDVAAGQQTAGADHGWQTESGRLSSSRQQGDGCKGSECFPAFSTFTVSPHFWQTLLMPCLCKRFHFTLLGLERVFSRASLPLALWFLSFLSGLFSSSCLFPQFI